MKLLRNGIGVFPIHTKKYLERFFSFHRASNNCYKNSVLNQKVSSGFDQLRSSLKFDLKMRISLILLIFGAFMLQASPTYAQKKISVNLENVTVERLLDEIESKTDFRFVYSTEDVDIERRVTIKVNREPVSTILNEVFTGTKTEFNIDDNGQIFLLVNQNPDPVVKSVVQQDPIRITGTVTDENGIPLNGASVVVQGTLIGVSTNFDGQYEIVVPGKESVLEFSYIGYENQQITIGSQFSINIIMKEAVGQLDEVVVSTGYYQIERRLNTGNIGKINSDIIERQPVVNPLEALQGQIAGVQINQSSGIPGSEVNIRIRGQNSINDGQRLGDLDLPNSNEPFYLVDGVPFPSNSLNTNGVAGGLRGGSPLTYLRPGDIESIQVLKDADATAIYGSRGANGVVLITTKKGKAGKTRITLDHSFGLGKVANRVDVLGTEDYLKLRREGISNDGIPLTQADSLQLVELFAWDQNRFTDWQSELTGGLAEQSNTSVTISGGSNQTQFIFRGNYFRQTNVFSFDDSAIKSGSGHFNLTHKSNNDKLKFDLSTTFSYTDNNQNGINFSSVFLPPNAPELFDDNGNLNFEDNFNNPLAILEQEYNNTSQNLIANLSVSYEVAKDLVLKSTFGFNSISTNESNIVPLSSLPPDVRGNGGSNAVSENSNETWIIEPQLNYSKRFGKNSLNFLLGGTWQNTQTDGFEILGIRYQSDVLIRNLLAAPELSVTRNNFSQYRYNAIFARINYSLDEKYILNLTGRRDGSSRFGPGRQFGNFGAVGVAWIFSEENFMKNSSFLSFGKLRGSYGLTGNDQIGDYGFLSTYAVNDVGNGPEEYDGNPALIITRATNPDYSWEENRKLEMGLELGFFKNRVRLNTSWFRNRSDNQLIGRPLSLVTGFVTTQFNLPALVENRGLEIELNTTNVKSDNFVWTSGLNFTRYRNELLEFPDIENFSPFDNRFVVGESLFGSKQLETIGVNPETGEYDFVDYNNDGRIDIEDRQDYVEVFQDFFAGLNNSLRWNQFELSFFLRFVKQNAFDFIGVPGSFNNQPVGVLRRWQNPGDITDVQRASRIGFQNNPNSSNSNLVDASFLRLQNVSFSWEIPEEIVSQIGLNSARIYLNGQNLLTITDFRGLDPETGATSLPPLRVITSGVQLTF